MSLEGVAEYSGKFSELSLVCQLSMCKFQFVQVLVNMYHTEKKFLFSYLSNELFLIAVKNSFELIDRKHHPHQVIV